MLTRTPPARAAIADADLALRGIVRRFGDVAALAGIDLSVHPGELVTILGPSGSGKTTLLKIIAGFELPDEGTVRLKGEDITFATPAKRGIGMVFQNYALFPHLSVERNVAFPLEMRSVPRVQIRERVAAILQLVGLAELSGRLPRELSGGQQQRVALARSVVFDPGLLLLDEPFGALDRKLREEMQIEVKHLQRELGITFVFVTHDQEEALTLSDRIAVMKDGEIQQAGTPTEIFEAPDNLFVAGFFGALNTLPVQVVRRDGANALVSWRGQQFAVAAKTPMTAFTGPEALFAARASDVRLSRTPPAGAGAWIGGVLEETIYKGTSVLCRVRLQDDTLFMVIAERGALGALQGGDAVSLSWPAEKGMLFPRPGGD